MKFLVSLFVVLCAGVAFGQEMAPIPGYQPVVVNQVQPPNPGNSLPFNTWTSGMTETWTNTQIHRIEPNYGYQQPVYQQQPAYYPGVYPGAGSTPCCQQQPCYQRPWCQQYYPQRTQSWYPGYYMGY